MPELSFEYFPGRTEKAKDQLAETVSILSQFQPRFQSVTYGAGGSNRDGTFEAVTEIQSKTGLPTASHLSFSGSSVEEVKQFADELWDAGVRQIVALRGDSEHEGDENSFVDTPEFIRVLKSQHDFEIAVACYPEVHPLADSEESDLKVLKEKQEAGATQAITQFFFDNSKFYEFTTKVKDAGITIPIIPGILPIYNFDAVKQIAGKCGAVIPSYIEDAFSDTGILNRSDQLEVAAEILKSQVHDLACAGYEAIHIYTLNRVELAKLAAETFNETHEKNRIHRKVA